jgi:hypothetical protein
MTTTSTQTGLTARAVLLGSDTQDDLQALRQALSEHGVLGQCGGEVARLTQEGREAAGEALASATAGLLEEVDLGDVLVYCWRTHDRLVNAAKDTVRTPGRQEIVQLASHEVSWTNNPTVDVLVDGAVVHTFRFQISITFDVQVAAAVIKEGKWVALKAGDTTVAVALALQLPGGDVELLRKEQQINVNLIVQLGDGIPLLPEEQVPAAAGDDVHPVAAGQ